MLEAQQNTTTGSWLTFWPHQEREMAHTREYDKQLLAIEKTETKIRKTRDWGEINVHTARRKDIGQENVQRNSKRPKFCS